MLVVVAYQFHDYEEKMYLVDTDSLDSNHPFESDLKKALEGKESYIRLYGEKYEDDWGTWEQKVEQKIGSPIEVDRMCRLKVYFEG